MKIVPMLVCMIYFFVMHSDAGVNFLKLSCSEESTQSPFLYSQLFKSFSKSGAPLQSDAVWTNSEYRFTFGACPELGGFVFCPETSYTNSATYYPWIFVSMPGKRNQFGYYSEALRVAKAADVRRLYLFHHDPTHDDDYLDARLAECRDDAGDDPDLDVEMAREGERVVIRGSGA